MPGRSDFERVRKAGLRIPGLEVSRAWNGPCLKADKKIAAIMAVHKSVEPGSLAAVVGEDVRDELIAEAPDIYYVTDHYLPWPVVLVRLGRVDDTTLRDLLIMAARYRTASARRGEER
jgi:hypothetical protein